MKTSPPDRPSDTLRPHLHLARQIALLALGPDGGGDQAIARSLVGLLNEPGKDTGLTPVYIFYKNLVRQITKASQNCRQPRLVLAGKDAGECIAHDLLQIDLALRLVLLLTHVGGLTEKDVAEICSIQPSEYRDRIDAAFDHLADAQKQGQTSRSTPSALTPVR